MADGSVHLDWTASGELKRNAAMTHLRELDTRRQSALNVLNGTLHEAGLNVDDIDQVIRHADALRRALAPFDLSTLRSQ